MNILRAQTTYPRADLSGRARDEAVKKSTISLLGNVAMLLDQCEWTLVKMGLPEFTDLVDGRNAYAVRRAYCEIIEDQMTPVLILLNKITSERRAALQQGRLKPEKLQEVMIPEGLLFMILDCFGIPPEGISKPETNGTNPTHDNDSNPPSGEAGA